MKKIINSMFAIIFALSVSAQDAKILNVPYIYQVHLCCWCWAATCNSVIEYYGTDVDLCEVVEYARSQNPGRFGTQNCCNTPTPSSCISTNPNTGTGSQSDILNHWGISNSFFTNSLSFSTVQTEIDAGRPVIFQWNWSSGGGHLLTCRGYDNPSSSLYYINPGDGYHIATYNWVVSGSNHTWAYSFQLNTTPVCSDANSEFSQPINSDINYEESNTIKINSTIDNNSNVEFKYGNEFIINPRFEIKQGSTITIEPDASLPCE